MDFLKKNKEFIIPALFLIELFLGFNGKMILIFNVPIRHILFLLTFFDLWLYAAYFFVKNKINLLEELKAKLNFLDISVAIFLFMMAVSMFIVPYFTHGNYKMSILEALIPFLIVSLYFPITFIVRNKRLNLAIVDVFLSYLVTILSALHFVFYVGQKFDHNFIENFFYVCKFICFQQAMPPVIVLGPLGYPRAIFTTSIFMIMGIYFFFKKIDNIKTKDYIFLGINILGLLSTITKSIWLGIVIAFMVFLALYMIVQVREKNQKNIKKMIAICIGMASFVIVSDFVIFDRFITIRISNFFVNTEISTNNTEEHQAPINNKFGQQNKWAEIDREGSIISNNIKIDQSYRLMKKWLERPILGFGYGSYIEDYVRVEENNSDYKFSYEMQLPALFMQTGILGMSSWGLIFLSMLYVVKKKYKYDYIRSLSWVLLSLAFFISVQTNPFLLSFVGMSILLYLLSYCSYFNDLERKSNEK